MLSKKRIILKSGSKTSFSTMLVGLLVSLATAASSA
jgi:hypothetical protein